MPGVRDNDMRKRLRIQCTLRWAGASICGSYVVLCAVLWFLTINNLFLAGESGLSSPLLGIVWPVHGEFWLGPLSVKASKLSGSVVIEPLARIPIWACLLGFGILTYVLLPAGLRRIPEKGHCQSCG